MSSERPIDGKTYSVKELLGGGHYSIDYYQREYRWGDKQIVELIGDLCGKFLENYQENHTRAQVRYYSCYFLGSVIISQQGGKNYIIDGQQRMTSLTLLLIHLNHLQGQAGDSGGVSIGDLIYSEQYGKKQFNIDVEERAACMEALFRGESFPPNEQSESIQNILARYEDIANELPSEVKGDVLPYFIDWLIENVHLVKITAFSDEEAYTIFETMNDRGLSLTPTEMLKGYLLAQLRNVEERNQANQIWRRWIEKLQLLNKEEDADCMKNWIRSQYAQNQRERKRDAAPRDFELIGTQFHRWIRWHSNDPNKGMNLSGESEFQKFITQEMPFYADLHLDLQRMAQEWTPECEEIFYAARTGFTLQYQAMMAPAVMGDSLDVRRLKARIVAAYIEMLLVRRWWNYKSISRSTMQYNMVLLMMAVRGKEPGELVRLLSERLKEDEKGNEGKDNLTFKANGDFALHGQNRKSVHYILARITSWLEAQTGQSNRYCEYMNWGKPRDPFEIEHIWADKHELHQDEFADKGEFDSYRNRIGGLLLLPKSFNASYGALPYADKRQHYNAQNTLARTLCDGAYERNPGLNKFLETSGLPFKPHPQFRKSDLEARQKLYIEICNRIWGVERLQEILNGAG